MDQVARQLEKKAGHLDKYRGAPRRFRSGENSAWMLGIVCKDDRDY
jgi:hypothetical protein